MIIYELVEPTDFEHTINLKIRMDEESTGEYVHIEIWIKLSENDLFALQISNIGGTFVLSGNEMKIIQRVHFGNSRLHSQRGWQILWNARHIYLTFMNISIDDRYTHHINDSSIDIISAYHFNEYFNKLPKYILLFPVQKLSNWSTSIVQNRWKNSNYSAREN